MWPINKPLLTCYSFCVRLLTFQRLAIRSFYAQSKRWSLTWHLSSQKSKVLVAVSITVLSSAAALGDGGGGRGGGGGGGSGGSLGGGRWVIGNGGRVYGECNMALLSLTKFVCYLLLVLLVRENFWVVLLYILFFFSVGSYYVYLLINYIKVIIYFTKF